MREYIMNDFLFDKKRWLDVWPQLRLMSLVEMFKDSVQIAKQTIAVIISLNKSNKQSPVLRHMLKLCSFLCECVRYNCGILCC